MVSERFFSWNVFTMQISGTKNIQHKLSSHSHFFLQTSLGAQNPAKRFWPNDSLPLLGKCSSEIQPSWIQGGPKPVVNGVMNPYK